MPVGSNIRKVVSRQIFSRNFCFSITFNFAITPRCGLSDATQTAGTGKFMDAAADSSITFKFAITPSCEPSGATQIAGADEFMDNAAGLSIMFNFAIPPRPVLLGALGS